MDEKFIGIWASIVWFVCQSGCEGLIRWVPRQKAFSPKLHRNYEMDMQFGKITKIPSMSKKKFSCTRAFYFNFFFQFFLLAYNTQILIRIFVVFFFKLSFIFTYITIF